MRPQTSLAARIAALDGRAIAADIAGGGFALTPPLLGPDECRALIALYPDDANFRSRVEMRRHGYGEGAYGYFAEPLPPLVATLREGLYPVMAPVADAMMAGLGRAERHPPTLDEYRARCAAAGQTKPTPLLLRYGAGGYNRLHRDLYGDLAFPLQLTFLLSDPDADFDGGSFLLVENRARQQARGEAVRLAQGQGIVFPVADRPVAGARGPVRAEMRHGVATITRGERYTLGIIFHDAR